MDANEDPQLSLPVSFNVSHIFPGDFAFAEVSLGGNQWIENMSRLHFKREGTVRQADDDLSRKRPMAERQSDVFQGIVTLNPMEIRTFIMSPTSSTNSGYGAKSEIAVGILLVVSFVFNFIVVRS